MDLLDPLPGDETPTQTEDVTQGHTGMIRCELSRREDPSRALFLIGKLHSRASFSKFVPRSCLSLSIWGHAPLLSGILDSSLQFFDLERFAASRRPGRPYSQAL